MSPDTGPPRTITPDEAETMQRRMTADQPWTPAQRAAIRRYTGGDYKAINGYLRTGQGGTVADRAAVAEIRAAMRPLPEGVVLTRSVRADAFGLTGFNGGQEITADEAAQLAGRTFHDPGVTSASVGSRGSGLRLQITAPAGTRAAYVDSISKNRGETEMMLDTGTHYRIDRVERHLLKGTTIYVTVVSQDA